jgi:hypothetical protein
MKCVCGRCVHTLIGNLKDGNFRWLDYDLDHIQEVKERPGLEGRLLEDSPVPVLDLNHDGFMMFFADLLLCALQVCGDFDNDIYEWRYTTQGEDCSSNYS